MLRLLTFGGLSLVDDGVAVTGAASQRSRLALLALLAAAGPAGMAREKVLACLWPESEDERARHALKQAVYALRRDLGSERAIAGTATLCLDPTLITSDIREFEEALARGDDAAAVAVYTGAFLDGVFVRGSPEFDQWAGVERSRLERAYLDAIARLARGADAAGDAVAAVQWWRRAAAAEPLSGRVAVSLMRALAESGDVSAAIQHARVHDAMVQAELESPADEAVLAFAEELRKGEWTPTVRPSADVAAVRASPSAGAVVDASEVVATEAAARAEPVAVADVPRPQRSRLVLAAAGLTLLLAVAAAGAFARGRMSPPSKPPSVPVSSRRIVVANFTNLTSDTTLNLLGQMATDLTIGRLLNAGFEVPDYETSAKVAGDTAQGAPKTVNERFAALADETGAATVVTGSYYLEGDSLRFQAKILDPRRKVVTREIGPVTGTVGEGSKLLFKFANLISGSLAAWADTAPGAGTTGLITPPSVEAYRHARSGWEMFFQSPADTSAAFAEFAHALKLDSAYTTPRLMRAYILDVKDKWSDLAKAVAELDSRRVRMGPVELEALALYEADLRGNLADRLRASRALLTLSPGSADMALLVAVSASYLQRPEEVLEVLRHSNPDRGINVFAPMYWAWRAEAEHSLGKFDEEQKSAAELTSRFPGQLYGAQAMARALAARGDTAALASHMRRAGFLGTTTSADGRTVALLAARELRAHGLPAPAKVLLARIAAIPPGGNASRDDRSKYALALYDAGDLVKARAEYTALLAADPRDLDVLGRLGAIAVRAGDSTTARQVDEKLAAWAEPYALGRPEYWRAHLAALRGRGSDAVGLLHRALQKGYRAMDLNIVTLHEEPDFMTLWSDPGFHDLVRPHNGPVVSP